MEERRGNAVRRTILPLSIGLMSMLGTFGPGWLPGTLALAGAFVSGMVNQDEPVRAGLLTVAFPFLGGLASVLIDEPSVLGALALSGMFAAALALFASYIGAGVRRRWSARGAATP